MVNGQVHVHSRWRCNSHTGPGGLQPLEFMEVSEKGPLKAALIATNLVEDLRIQKHSSVDQPAQAELPSLLPLPAVLLPLDALLLPLLASLLCFQIVGWNGRTEKTEGRHAYVALLVLQIFLGHSCGRGRYLHFVANDTP